LQTVWPWPAQLRAPFHSRDASPPVRSPAAASPAPVALFRMESQFRASISSAGGSPPWSPRREGTGRKTPKEARAKVAAAAAAVSGSPPDSWCGTLGCRNPGLRPGLRQRSGQSTCRFLSSTSIILFSPPPILVHSKRVHHLNYTLEQIRCRCH